MTNRLPLIHIRRLVAADGQQVGDYELGRLDRLIDLLAEADAETPSAGFLAAGLLPVQQDRPPVLFATEETRTDWLARWCQRLAASTYSSLLFVGADELDEPGRISAGDMPLVVGAGAIPVSRGETGEPLVGLELAALRRQLAGSRERLSEAAGFPIRMLAPTPTATGRAIDGLVAREARRAGYTTLLKPGASRPIETPLPDDPVPYYTCQPEDAPEQLRDWVLGGLIALGSTRLKQLTSTPRAWLERFS